MSSSLPGTEPFEHAGGPVGVLLCHGFTGSPQTLRPWAEHVAQQGFTVSLPRLPGHGTTWQDLARTGSQDWYGEVDRAFRALASRCEQTFVFGLSMGGCLALRLAEVHGSAVRGLVLVNPSLAPDTKLFLLAPVLKHVPLTLRGIASDIKKPGAHEIGYDRVPIRAAATLPQLWGATTQQLGKVTQPVLVYRSTVDHVVGPTSMKVLLAGLPKDQVTVRECADSYHVATLDNDAEAIFEGSVKFVQEHSGEVIPGRDLSSRHRAEGGYRGGQASIRSGGDVPDWDNTESRERDEDAAWRDLVARFDEPLTAQQPIPWPACEDTSPQLTRETDGAGGAEEARGFDGKHRGPEVDGLEAEHGGHAADVEPGRHVAGGEPGPNAADKGPERNAAGRDDGLAGPNGEHGPDGLGAQAGGVGPAIGRRGRLGADEAHDPEVIQVPRRIRGPAARDVPADGAPADDDEHYIPPTPPPLPKLDPVAKGAWVALFGGPGYLMVATAAGWSVSGLAAFCAVAAFVAGFAILVLRMHEPGPGGPDDGDDGAVV